VEPTETQARRALGPVLLQLRRNARSATASSVERHEAAFLGILISSQFQGEVLIHAHPIISCENADRKSSHAVATTKEKT